ncbi:MAG: DNRLRE domain-containing protein [Ardenticatenaceae bacterium]|nr:DNRLRE domain-containing protein [Ardenticatenaceae bacterium]
MTRPNSPHKTVLFPLAALLLFAILGLATTLFASGDDVFQTPEADAYVISGAPTENFGTRPDLQAKNGSGIVSYLRFEVSGWNDQTAILSLYALNGDSEGVDIYAVSDSSWEETAITAGNAPALGSLIASSGSLTANTWVDIDVTSAITGNGLITLAIRNDSSALLRFASREAESTAPQLNLNAVGSNPSSTTVPNPTSTPEPSPTPNEPETCTRGGICPPNIDPGIR